MAEILKVSEATNLAIHAMAYLASAERAAPVIEIADRLAVSRGHLGKVLQRLARARLVRSRRGPRGGYALNGPAAEITLLEIVEATEGPLEPVGCLFGQKLCGTTVSCLLGALAESVHQQVRQLLASTPLSALAATVPASVLAVTRGRS